jgi:hypothetical protein
LLPQSSRNYIVFAKKETNRIFDKQINLITYQKNPMGIEEYLADIEYQKGKVEATEKVHRQIVVNLLKGTNHSVAKIANLTGVSVYYVKKVKASLNTKTTRRRLSTSK